jgi:eukaryotic-like serine/threonine-protein kinase
VIYTAGTRLGPYEISAPIGAGGMGEVYRARDTRLGRDVAIKASAERFSERFEREARAVAALNHTNICTLYDVGPDYLVMELVEGPTLAERIHEGPLPLEEALSIARQIAAALEAAHEKAIIHRDLKPANVKLTPGGGVKVLDFGLAKTIDAASLDSSNSPTFVGTQGGVILGTAGYMAPEQARGRAVDKRADIWAFGVVLYEMLTGRMLFEGETISDTIAAVLTKPIDWSAVPIPARRLLQSCIERDPKRRLRDIGDIELLLGGTVKSEAGNPKRWLWPTIAATTALLAAGVSALYLMRPAPRPPDMARFQIFPPEPVRLTGVPIVSPDGRRVAFEGTVPGGHTTLWVRDLDTLQARRLDTTEDATPARVFWSPDSRYIAFVADGKLKKVPAGGGPAQVLTELQNSIRGGAWNEQGVIIFGSGSGVLRLPDTGGSASPVTTLETARGENMHVVQAFLPDGKHFLYVRNSAGQMAGLCVGSLDSKPEEQGLAPLMPAGVVVGYASGYLFLVRDGTLSAQRFDTNTLRLEGDWIPLAENVAAGAFSVSTNGVLAYRNGVAPTSQLLWFDRQGKQLGSLGPPGLYQNTVVLSLDGKRLFVDPTDLRSGTPHVSVVDLARGVFTRLTPGNNADYAIAPSPDGRIAFTSASQPGGGDIYVTLGNGAGTPELLVKSGNIKHPNHWSFDGKYIIYDEHTPNQREDLFVVPMSGDRKPIPFLTTPADETDSEFSPDSRFVTYSSDESGRREVYVRDFAPDRVPATGNGKWQISTAGGAKPRWSRDGKEIYYIAADRKLMAVPVKAGATFEPGTPVPLFEVNPSAFEPYDVTADGRFIIATNLERLEADSDAMTVVLNWMAGIRK